jgi:hypothetical protein
MGPLPKLNPGSATAKLETLLSYIWAFILIRNTKQRLWEAVVAHRATAVHDRLICVLTKYKNINLFYKLQMIEEFINYHIKKTGRN